MAEITRKDRLSKNISRMRKKHGVENFDFLPTTFILPEEFPEFQDCFVRMKEQDQRRNIWILKPANASEGRGISIVDDLRDVVIDDTSVIQRYITNPLLINGHKFDLRIYVLITSYEPLRIYVF